MTRGELITQISTGTDISEEDVEMVLAEEDDIIEKELKRCKRKKCMIFTILMLITAVGAGAMLYFLDRREKIDIEAAIKKYMDKIKKQTQ